MFPLKKNKQLIEFRKRESITRSVEILLLFAVAYNFAEWGTYESFPAKMIGIFACIYVFNNWITTLSSFSFYRPAMFPTDILIVFLSINLPNALRHNVQPWAYSPQFWLLMGGMELVNVYWNLQIMYTSPSEAGRSGIRMWLILTVIVMCGCFGLYIYLQFSPPVFMGQLLAGLLAFSMFAMTIVWNINRYRMLKKEGISFLD